VTAISSLVYILSASS